MKQVTTFLSVVFALNSAALSADEATVLSAPLGDDVRSQVLNWVAERQPEPDVLQEVGRLWAEGEQERTPSDRLELLVRTGVLVDKRIAAFIDRMPATESARRAPSPPWTVETVGPFVHANLQLFWARHLTQLRMFDEALVVFAEVDRAAVVDPAGCLFFHAVCQHALLKKEAGLATLKTLLRDTESVPERYLRVAELMQHDLQSYRAKTLDEIARKMSDSGRRLELGRGGQRVQKVQGEIIAGLDEIIEKLEQQSGGGGGGGQSPGSRSNQSSNPANDSVVKGQKAPGNVDRRDLTQRGGWGALHPKQEARAKNIINRDFPAHYRRALEAYFKKLASRSASAGN